MYLTMPHAPLVVANLRELAPPSLSLPRPVSYSWCSKPPIDKTDFGSRPKNGIAAFARIRWAQSSAATMHPRSKKELICAVVSLI